MNSVKYIDLDTIVCVKSTSHTFYVLNEFYLVNIGRNCGTFFIAPGSKLGVFYAVNIFSASDFHYDAPFQTHYVKKNFID